MRVKFSKIKKAIFNLLWYLFLTFVAFTIFVICWAAYYYYRHEEAKVENFRNMIGRYKIDTSQTMLGTYLKDIKYYQGLEIVFKADSTFEMNMSVPFIYDSVGTWEAGGGSLDEWNELYYRNTEIPTQFTDPWTNDSIFYMNSVTPKKNEIPVSVIYFKKIK